LAIDALAVVHPRARLGSDVSIGPYSIVGEHVEIGDETAVGSGVLIDGWTAIGRQCEISHGAVIGTPPQDIKYEDERSYCRIGDRNVIREYVTVNRATGEEKATTIGDDNLIMAYAHVAHNCKLADHIVVANAVNMAGHVTIEDHAMVSGLIPIHQFVRIGCYSMIGGGSRVTQDVIPYGLAAGNPLRLRGLNMVGLRRHGFPEEVRSTLKEAFRLLFRSGLNTSQALSQISSDLPAIPEVEHLVGFIGDSKRGIAK
jgi:UDP-N-acetylglucosamine acyltransferase